MSIHGFLRRNKMDSVSRLLLSCIIIATGVAGKLCPEGEPVSHFDAFGETNPSVFDDLTSKEIQAAYDYISGIDDLNIKAAEDVTINSTYVYLIDFHPPPKGDVLQHLDSNGPKPDRFARIVLYRGDLTPPVIEEYKVGPLPAIEGHERLKVSGSDSVEYRKRNLYTQIDLAATNNVIMRETAAVDHILRQVVGWTFNNCSDKCLVWEPGLPGRLISRDRSMFIMAERNLGGYHLHQIGFEFRITMGEKLHPDLWTVDYVWFRGDIYESMAQMAAQYELPTPVDPIPIYVDDRNLYSNLHHRGNPVPKKKQRGPRSFMPDGRRYSVNGHHVEWQGWSLDFGLRSVMGLQVHDIRFKGERIAYEIGISEISIAYSGPTASPQHSIFTDSSFYIGAQTLEMIPGVDCPDHATFFSFSHFIDFKPVIVKNSACVFEHDRGIPLRHHTAADQHGSYTWKQGMPGNVLILRSVITVYNYEYILDYVFHQNGAMDVIVSLSGYILSVYYTGDPADDRYGFQVSPDGTGQIHNHMLHIKADLDILGTENRFETLDIGYANVNDMADPSKRINVQKIARNLRNTEKEAALKYNFDQPKYLIINNNNHVNKYGNPRGYRLLPVHVNKQVLPEGWTVEKGISWSRYQVAVTKQKDDEPRSSSIYNNPDNVDPTVNFQDFIDDDEPIVDEDLVAWISLGTFHIPHSEDIPIVQTPGLSLTFSLLPFNFFQEDVSLASRDNIRVDRAGGRDHFSYVGVSPDVKCGLVKDPVIKASRAVNVEPAKFGTIVAIVALVWCCFL